MPSSKGSQQQLQQRFCVTVHTWGHLTMNGHDSFFVDAQISKRRFLWNHQKDRHLRTPTWTPGHGSNLTPKIGWWILNLDLNLWSPKPFILTHTSKRQRNPTHLEFRRPNIFERPRRPGPNFSVVGAKLFTSQVALVCTATPSNNLERRETASIGRFL